MFGNNSYTYFSYVLTIYNYLRKLLLNVDEENIHITSEETCDILKCLKLCKATGLYKMCNHMLKMTSQSICKPLSILFNLSLEKMKFPSSCFHIWNEILEYWH